MEQYIPKSALVAEINSRININETCQKISGGHEFYRGAIDEAKVILSFLDILEVKDVDTIKCDWYNQGYLKGRKEANIPARELGLPKSCDFQQEQPEVDLKKEFDNYTKNILACDVQHEPFTHLYNCAKHFYELGISARKEE